jgi:acetyl-CoA acetyltransferase family protein
MDEWSLRSHQRAAAATDAGAFAREILPVPVRDGSGVETGETMTADEGIRRNTSMDKLAALGSANAWKPELAPDITAGNSSQVSDGAAAMLIASRDTAEKLGLRPRAVFRHFAVGADSAVWVLTAPNPVTRKCFARSGLSADDFDAIEVNEAFASITLAWAREFLPDTGLLNSRGGAVAIGHPLGASGVRLLITLLHTLEDTGGRLGFSTMCEGGGQANATVLERLG